MATYFGTEGNDSISGGGEPDNIDGNGGNDFFAGNGDNDFSNGGSGNDTLFGDSGNDVLAGGDGNDVISGGSGQDIILFREFGAANADSVSYDANWDRIQLDAAAFANIGASGRFAAGDLRFYAAPGATAGHDADDRIVYNTSTGQLFYDADGSGPGASQLIATFQGAPNIPATDINVIGTATPSPTPTPTGQTITGTEGNDSLVGGPGNDTLFGLGGNDTIDGGPEADSMIGGTGDDLYFVDHTGDVIVEQQNGGVDEVRSVAGYTLPDWVNNLTLVDSPTIHPIFGGGNAIENVITGNQLDNRLFGMDGNDTVLGMDGNDTLDGGTGNNQISGGNGDDVINKTGWGNDTVDGGAGLDNVFLQNAQTPVTANFGTGVMTGGDASGTAQSMLSNVENLDAGALNASVSFTGSSGNDLLRGGTQADLLIGGAGNDILY